MLCVDVAQRVCVEAGSAEKWGRLVCSAVKELRTVGGCWSLCCCRACLSGLLCSPLRCIVSMRVAVVLALQLAVNRHHHHPVAPLTLPGSHRSRRKQRLGAAIDKLACYGVSSNSLAG